MVESLSRAYLQAVTAQAGLNYTIHLLPGLVKATAGSEFPVEEVLADKGLLSAENVATIASVGGRPVHRPQVEHDRGQRGASSSGCNTTTSTGARSSSSTTTAGQTSKAPST